LNTQAEVGQILDRIKTHFLISTDKELREVWNIGRSTLDGWKKNGIPPKAIMKLAREYQLNPEWITTGEGEVKQYVTPLPDPKFITKEIYKVNVFIFIEYFK